MFIFVTKNEPKSLHFDIEVYNINGTLVKVLDPNSNKQFIGDVAEGVYWITIQTERNVYRKRVFFN